MNHVPIRDALQLATYLRSLRRLRGWTQAELGQRLGISQPRVAEIERYPDRVSVKQLLDVLATLGGRLVGLTQPSENATEAGARISQVQEPDQVAYRVPVTGPADPEPPTGEW